MQKELISNLLRRNKNAVIVGSLGTISYDLTQIEHPKKILIRGAMGCALGVGLGYALASDKKVIVIIGDGSLLMKLGSISTVLAYKPKNLEVHVIQNNSYASTGGQKINFKFIKKYLPKSFKIHEIIC